MFFRKLAMSFEILLMEKMNRVWVLGISGPRTSPKTRQKSKLFIFIIIAIQSVQCVEETTSRRGLDDHDGSLLDLITTDSKARVLDVKNQVTLGSSSTCHSVLNWKFAVGRMSNEAFRPRRRWLNGSYIKMSEEILKTD